MKKYLLGFLGVLLVLGIWMNFETFKARSASYFSQAKSGAATSSPTYLATGSASSTLTSNFGDADSAYMYLNSIASTTGTVFQFAFQYSVDGVDWFGEEMASSSMNLSGAALTQHSSSTVVHLWTPGSLGTTSKMIKIPDGVGNFVRVTYRVLNANGSLWIDILPKRLRF